MAIDPVMLALCRGKGGAGASQLPCVVLTTPLSLNQETPLSDGESLALAAAAEQHSPAVLGVQADVAEDYLWVVAGLTGGSFFGSVILGADVVSVMVQNSGIEIDPPDGESGTYYRYVAMIQGATLTPVDPE